MVLLTKPPSSRSVIVPALAVAWLVAVGIYLQWRFGLANVFALSPGDLGGVIAGIVAPLAVLGVIVMLTGWGRDSHGAPTLDRVGGSAGVALDQAAARRTARGSSCGRGRAGSRATASGGRTRSWWRRGTSARRAG